MPRLTARTPRLCRHKGTGQAVVYLDGREVYLGRYGTPESRDRYKEAIAEWAGRRRPAGEPEPAAKPPPKPAVADLMLLYKRHSERYYQSREVDNVRAALRPVRALFGRLEAAQFGPAQLRKVREQMIRAGLARGTINARVGRIRRFFRWCVAHEHLHPDVAARLSMVEALKRGRGGREPEKVRPVPWADVEAILPHLPPMVRSMVLFAWHTAARPGEVVALTTADIDRSGDVWIATLSEHKTAHHGTERIVPIGPKAQAALAPWLLPDRPDEPVFSPRRVDARQPKRRGRRLPGREYSRSAFRQVIVRACRRAGIEPWNPNRLRHSAATEIRRQFGLEAAQVFLGHQSADVTQLYAEKNVARALEVARMVG